MIQFEETAYGFKWGGAKIERVTSNPKQGWVVLRLQTPKHKGNDGFEIYVTKTGKVRIFDYNSKEITK